MAVIGLLALVLLAAAGGGVDARPSRRAYKPHVVVATIDTGINPFHPAWRRPESRHPSTYIPGFPTDAPPLELTLTDDYRSDVDSSSDELDRMAKEDRYPYWVPGTNIVGLWADPSDNVPVFDQKQPGSDPLLGETQHSHGAQAASQIAGTGYGLASDAYLVALDRDSGDSYATNAEALKWAADQSWIDIIHVNMQNPQPMANEDSFFPGYPDAVRYALDKGKVVVTAAGNFYAEPSETSPHTGPRGVLIAGANDNCGYSDYSNLNPHVVMDGDWTEAAHPDSYETKLFSGTSSSSPRTAGYVAQLLLELRRAYGYRGGMSGDALIVLPSSRRPSSGPLADGRLTAAELHEVVRKTADPNPHASKWDGERWFMCVPQPVDSPVSVYPKMGYGEVSEHTLGAALDVLTGSASLPERPVEDAFFNASEELRAILWPE